METNIRVLIVDFNSEFCRLLSEQMGEAGDLEVNSDGELISVTSSENECS